MSTLEQALLERLKASEAQSVASCNPCSARLRPTRRAIRALPRRWY